MEMDEKEWGDEDDKKRKADGTVLTLDTDKKAKAKESSMGKVAPGAFDSKAKEERVEVSRKRTVKDEDNEEKTAKYIKKLEQKEKKKKKEREGDDGDVCVDEVGEKVEKGSKSKDSGDRALQAFVVNEEAREVDVDELGEEEWNDEDELDPAMVEEGRREEVEFMVKKLDMFEFGDYEEAVARGGKQPTTARWVEGWKIGEDGKRFVRCRLVGRDFKGKRGGVRDDLFASMPPLEAKKILFRVTAGIRGVRKRSGKKEVKLMFIDVRKAHLNARCDEEEWVELPEEMWKWGKYAKLRRWLYGMRKAASGWEEDYFEKLEAVGFTRGRGAPAADSILEQDDGGQGGGARR